MSISNVSLLIVQKFEWWKDTTIEFTNKLVMTYFPPDLLALSQVIQREEDVCVLADGVVREAL